MTKPTILQITDLSFNYPERELFNGVSLYFAAGVSLIRGGDGRGKTSLLRLIAGELAAHGGRLAIKDIRLDDQTADYKKQIYYVDPRTEKFDQMTVSAYFASVRTRFPGFDEAALPGLVEGLALTPHWEKKLFMLSTGSKRKVFLAGAFAAGAMVNLLDDPFASLDKASINFVIGVLMQVNVQTSAVWIASFYEVPVAFCSSEVVDLGD